MDFGKKIEEIMNWKGMNQSGLARKSGIPATTVSSYIRNNREPSAGNLLKIADALDVSITVLYDQNPLPTGPVDITQSESGMIRQHRAMNRGQKALIQLILDYYTGENGRQGGGESGLAPSRK